MIKQVLFLGCGLLTSLDALAANCDARGGLLFIGTTADASRSVWLSGTSAGDFSLNAAQGNLTVDQWSKSKRGLRLTLSPVVSNGNGGTHKLFNDGAKPCLLASQNQKDGIILPPIVFPPEGITPELPGVGGRPVPPIGTLPPSGITPERPGIGGGTVPPIGTLPPSGITPERPGIGGGPVPPIGTLPPSGITPERPGIGGGTVPPIGTLPPSGITPERPGIGSGPVPPIGTLPPSGITPERPGIGGGAVPPIGTLPPTGITPERPGIGGGAVPPIGTLPPTGITPERPGIGGGAVPPIGTLPPTGITPERPGVGGGTVPPVGVLPPESTNKMINQQTRSTQTEGDLPPCQGEFKTTDGENTRAVAELYGCQGLEAKEQVPLSKGRDLAASSNWNVWVDTLASDISDDRYDRDVDGYNRVVAIGIDRLLTNNLIAGASLNIEASGSKGFNKQWEVETQGVTLRPYLAYRYSTNWTFTTLLGMGYAETDEDLTGLSGSFDITRYSLNVSASGNYLLENVVYRPSISVFYGEEDADNYTLSGAIGSQSVAVDLKGERSHFGSISFSNELSMLKITDSGLRLFPFVSLDISYDFDRPNDGEILSSDLVYKDVSPWLGSLSAGVRFLANPQLQIELSGGYMTLGQSDLDEWQGRLYISNAF